MRKFLGTATTNRFAGVFTGIVATTLLESSSVTIIMVIAMVSSGVLTFVQSLGVVLGSNIGTAVGAQIISLDIKHYVPALMGVGVLSFLLGRTRTQKNRQAVRTGVVHLLFNLIGVVVVIGFLPAIARGLEWIIPDAPWERQPYPEAVQASRRI